VSSPQLIPRQRTPRADLTPILENDLGEVAGFIAQQSGRSREVVENHLRWFLLENPVREAQHPLGIGLRSADRLTGCILYSPQEFSVQEKKILLMGSSSFYVDEAHRGQGGRIFLQYSRLARQWPLFGTSANAEAASLWKAAGATPIPYSEGELFGVLRWPPLVEEFAHRKNADPAVARLAGSPAANLAGLFLRLKLDCETSDSLQQLTSAEQVNDLFPIHDSSPKLTAVRDLPYVRWRYFSGRDATVAVFAFPSRQPDQKILITVNQRPRGYRGQINTLNLLDVYPEASAQQWMLIVGALIARYRKVVDAIVLRSQHPDIRKAFCARGFQWRMFDSPNGWFLDRNRLLPTQEWYPVPADGDGLI